MKIEIQFNDRKVDLREFSHGTKVGVMMGTFDPMHITHIDFAIQTLDDCFKEGGNNYACFYLHNGSDGKKPASLSDREKIMRELLLYTDKPNIGVLCIDDPVKGGIFHGCTFKAYSLNMFQLLGNYHELHYSMLLGSDRLDKYLSTVPATEFFVHARSSFVINRDLPEKVHVIRLDQDLSSTQLRNGEVAFGPEYTNCWRLLQSLYPNARFEIDRGSPTQTSRNTQS